MSDGPDSISQEQAAKPCAICRKSSQLAYRPFCSKRCADIDLNRWLTGAYAVPVAEDDDEDGEDEAREGSRLS